MTVPSIPLEKLVNILSDYLKEHPESAQKPVYHDCLHLEGGIDEKEKFIELW